MTASQLLRFYLVFLVGTLIGFLSRPWPLHFGAAAYVLTIVVLTASAMIAEKAKGR